MFVKNIGTADEAKIHSMSRTSPMGILRNQFRNGPMGPLVVKGFKRTRKGSRYVLSSKTTREGV